MGLMHPSSGKNLLCLKKYLKTSFPQLLEPVAISIFNLNRDCVHTEDFIAVMVTLITIVMVFSVHCMQNVKAVLLGGLLILYTGCVLIAIFIEKMACSNTEQEFSSFYSAKAPYHQRLEAYQDRNKCCGKEGLGDFVFGSIAKGCCGATAHNWNGKCEPGLERGCLPVFQSHYVLIMVCHGLAIVCHILLVIIHMWAFAIMRYGQWEEV